MIGNFYDIYRQNIHKQYINKYVYIHYKLYCIQGIILDAFDEFVIYIGLNGDIYTTKVDYMEVLNKTEKEQFDLYLNINNLYWNGKELEHIMLDKRNTDLWGVVTSNETIPCKRLEIYTNIVSYKFNVEDNIHIIKYYKTFNGVYALAESKRKLGFVAENCFQITSQL